MLDSKFLITLVGLLVTVLAICKTNMSPSTNEGFWNSGVQYTTKTMVEAQGTDGSVHAIKGNYYPALQQKNFLSYPSFQSQLSPRFSNTQYGANIKYNLPSHKNMAAPCNPLDFGNMAKEGYSSNYSVANCGEGVTQGSGDQGSSSGSSDSLSALSHGPSYMGEMNGDLMPIGTMDAVNDLGDTVQPIIYERLMSANLGGSRLRAQADVIRGDLPIAPSQGQWFNVHPNFQRDTQQGALNVMGGHDNDTSKALSAMMHSTSMGTHTIHAGMDINPSSQFNVGSSAAGGDVYVKSCA